MQNWDQEFVPRLNMNKAPLSKPAISSISCNDLYPHTIIFQVEMGNQSKAPQILIRPFYVLVGLNWSSQNIYGSSCHESKVGSKTLKGICKANDIWMDDKVHAYWSCFSINSRPWTRSQRSFSHVTMAETFDAPMQAMQGRGRVSSWPAPVGPWWGTAGIRKLGS